MNATFFDDLRLSYHDAASSVRQSKSLPNGQLLRVSQNGVLRDDYPPAAYAVLRSFEQNELAYKVVADKQSLVFNLDVQSVPAGATVCYYRKNDPCHPHPNQTNSTIPRSRRRSTLVLWLFDFVGFALYLALATRFVRIVSIPTLQDSIAVSVGFERTPFAKALGQASDADLLRLRGPQEEEIQKLWTFRSLILTRLALWTFYCVVISAFVAIFSLGVLEHA